MKYDTTKFTLVVLVCLLVLGLAAYLPRVVGAPAPENARITFTGGRNGLFCGVGDGKDIQCNKDSSGDESAEFIVEDQQDGTYALKSVATGQYCHDQGNRVVCHSDVVGAHEKFFWIDQGGDKFSLTGPKSGKKRLFCADDQSGGITCNRGTAGAWETFTLKSSHSLPTTMSDDWGGDSSSVGGGGGQNFWQWFMSFFF